MNDTAKSNQIRVKKSFLLKILFFLFFAFFLTGLYLYSEFYSWDRLILFHTNGVRDFDQLCNITNCEIDESTETQIFTIENVVQVKDSRERVVLVSKIWNEENNRIEEVEFFFRKNQIPNLDSLLMEGEYSRIYEIEVSAETSSLPGAFSFHNLRPRFLFAKILSVSIANESFIQDSSELSLLSERLGLSLGREVEDGEVSIERYFEKQGTLSEYRIISGIQYLEVLISEIKGRINNDVPEADLKSNCAVLKKYFPESACVYEETEYFNGVLAEYISSLFDISDLDQISLRDWWDIEGAIARRVLNDSTLALKKRNDTDYWLNKSHRDFVWKDIMSIYIDSVLEYIYLSGYTCEEDSVRELCENLLFLYNYSEIRYKEVHDTSLGFCPQIYFLPLLYEVSGGEEDLIATDISHVLENYPFISECTEVGGSEGLCSYSLKERIYCMRFLSDSLLYFEDNEEVFDMLETLVLDTISVYWRDFESIEGLWAKEDVNTLVYGYNDWDEVFPTRQFSYLDNYRFYKILETHFK